jgi:hypothetical protein
MEQLGQMQWKYSDLTRRIRGNVLCDMTLVTLLLPSATLILHVCAGIIAGSRL